MNLSPRAQEEPEINLIPMIDVVLMLVLFFMLSSKFVDERHLMLRLPEASSAAIERTQSRPLVVTVSQSGAYRVNDRELVNSSPDTLRNAVLKVAGADRSGVVLVRADARATHQSVVTAMDVLGKLGFRDINIATVDAGSRAGTR